ncbi:MAG: septal ring lytic transglycosylase RlpA family protein [Proteobacteria bacterium]|nr:septal ring lytic transglycosylase RlpA family protein [Pseudomonadota bacterium]
MFTYQVQKGDTIAQVTRQLGTNWETLREKNPEAIGRSRKNGNWFLKEGATLKTENSFQDSLQQAKQQRKESSAQASTPLSIPLPQPSPLFMTAIEQDSTRPEPSPSDSGVVEHTIQAGETLWELAVKKYHVHVDDIMKDNGITDAKTLQIGQTIKINLPEKTGEEQVVASWYGKDFHGKPMANGDIYNMYGATIAHKEIPLGTKVELKNKDTGQTVQAVVTDRGPYIEGRDVDLSYGLAKKLSLLNQGVGSLVMRIL